MRQKLPRRVVSRRKWSDVIIHTDAATDTMITPIPIFDRAEFPRAGEILAARTQVGSADRIGLFLEANLICGSELLEIVLTTADPTVDLDNKSVAFYIDNDNAISALVKADIKRIAIAILARLFWAFVAWGGVTPWFERVGS